MNKIETIMFSKKKKKIEISAPSNFQHRVHTGFENNKFVGLPKQWASLVDDKPGMVSNKISMVTFFGHNYFKQKFHPKI